MRYYEKVDAYKESYSCLSKNNLAFHPRGSCVPTNIKRHYMDANQWNGEHD